MYENLCVFTTLAGRKAGKIGGFVPEKINFAVVVDVKE